MNPDIIDIIAEACGAVRQQAPHDLRPGSCQNFAIGLAWLLHHHGIQAQIVGGYARWTTGPGPEDYVEYDPDQDPQSFHAWCAIDGPAGRLYADPTTLRIWREQLDPVWRYEESELPLPQIIQAQERLCAIQADRCK